MTHFSVKSGKPVPREPSGGPFLLVAPKLRLLDVNHENLRFAQGHPRLSSLTTLSLHEKNPTEQLLSIFETCAFIIQSLSLTTDWRDVERHRHRVPISMPVLTFLSIHQSFPQDIIFKAPVLEHLMASSPAISETLSPFVDEHRHSISELSITGTGSSITPQLTGESLDIIGGLENLKSLSNPKGSDIGALTVEHSFFQRLAEELPPFWPRLRVVNLRNMEAPWGSKSESSNSSSLGPLL